jgi:WD40 repeat protein
MSIYDAAFTADERFAISCGSDGTVRFWDLKTGKEVLRHQDLGEIYALQLSRDGRTLLTTGGRKVNGARLYRLPQAFWPMKQ